MTLLIQLNIHFIQLSGADIYSERNISGIFVVKNEYRPQKIRVFRRSGGGEKLIGRNLLDCHNPESVKQIKKVVEWFAAADSHNIVYTSHNEKQNKDVYMVALRENGQLIGYYEKHEYRNAETMNTYDLFA